MPEPNKVEKLSPAPQPEELTFKNTVFLAYTDVAAVGSRALLGINMRKEYFNLDVPELSSLKPACVRDAEPDTTHDQQFSALQVLNCKYEQFNDEFTIVVVNAAVPGLNCHYVAGKIIDICIRSKVEKIVILTALNIELPQFETDMFENTFNKARTVTTHPPIPGSTKICDSFLSTMIQMIQVEGLPCNVLTVPSNKVAPGKANREDGTLQNITLFQDTLTQITRLRFNRDLSASLVFHECTDPNGDLTTMIYI